MINRRKFCSAVGALPFLNGFGHFNSVMGNVVSPTQTNPVLEKIFTPLTKTIFHVKELDTVNLKYNGKTVPACCISPKNGLSTGLVTDSLAIPTYDIGSCVDWKKKYNHREDIKARAYEVLYESIRKKIESDAMHCLISAANDRNVFVYDEEAICGEFTRRFVGLLKYAMINKDGKILGKTPSRTMTHLLSPYEIDWPWKQRTKFLTCEELQPGGEYYNFMERALNWTPPMDTEATYFGLDLSEKEKSFLIVLPTNHPFEVVEEELNKERMQATIKGRIGICVMDPTRVLMGIA